MLFLSRLVLWALPKPTGEYCSYSPIQQLHRDHYFAAESEVVHWCRVQLEKHDLAFTREQAMKRMMADREKAEARGIGPMDPRYPELFDYMLHP